MVINTIKEIVREYPGIIQKELLELVGHPKNHTNTKLLHNYIGFYWRAIDSGSSYKYFPMDMEV